jgi:predicted amidohydrolase
MKIALVSLNQVWEDKKTNQANCKEYIEKASVMKADLIIFPEMTLTGFSMNINLIGESPVQSDTLEFFTKHSKINNIAIAFGVVFRKDDKATNNLIILDKRGTKLANYAKIHPFSFSGENNYFEGGEELGFCSIADADIGLSVCYDIRFPEMFQALSKKCNLILTIANWPEKRIKHWNTLLEARAIENQLFMIGVNRTGTDGHNLRYVKSSVVFDPSGEKIESIHSYLDMDIFDLELSKTQTVRKGFPVKQDRKTEFYKSIL